MKKHGILLLFLGLMLFTNAQIKEIKECRFTPKTKKEKAKLISESLIIYNKYNQKITVNKFTLNDGILYSFDSSSYIYNHQKQLIKANIHKIEENILFKQKIDYKYDSILLIKKKITNLYKTEDVKYFTYKYNKYLRKISRTEYSNNHLILNKHYYNITYDELNRPSYTRNTDMDTIFNLEECEYIYENGVVLKKNCDSHFSMKWSDFFDKNGNMIEKRYYEADPSDTIWMEKWNYFNNGTLKSDFIYNPDKGEKNLKLYNAMGLIESETIKDFNDKTILSKTYKYKYDKRKNWTKKTQYLNSKKVEVTLREIKYY